MRQRFRTRYRRHDQSLTTNRIAGYNRQHRALYAALLSRDVETAVRVITAHLVDTRIPDS